MQINSVSPKVVLTDLGIKVWGDLKRGDPMRSKIPAGRFCHLIKVADTILFLLSSASIMINGHDLLVNGGYTALCLKKKATTDPTPSFFIVQSCPLVCLGAVIPTRQKPQRTFARGGGVVLGQQARAVLYYVKKRGGGGVTTVECYHRCKL